MRTRYYRLALIFAMLFITGTVLCQSAPGNWETYYIDECVQIDICPAQRNDSANGIFNNYYLLRVTNTTDSKVLLTFRKELEYNREAAVTSEKTALFELAPHQSLEGSSAPETDKSLRIFINQPGGMNKNVLTNFALVAVQSSEIKE